MKEYSSCFIGIPLPDIFQKNLQKLLSDISKINPLTDLYKDTPHITLYFLDKQSENSFHNIADDIKSHLPLLKNSNLTLGGFGLFESNPKVLFLDSNYPESLKNFTDLLTRSLDKYHPSSENLPFHPHLTLGRFRTPEAIKSLDNTKSRLKRRLELEKWQFQLTEIAFFGKLKNPNPQEKLISFHLD